MPGDKGAFILNTTTKEMEEAMGLLDGLKALVNRAFRKDGKDGRKETDMAEDGIEDRISAIEKKIEEVQAKIEALGAAVDELKGVDEGILQREKDLKWTEVKVRLAPGLVHNEKEDEMRMLWEKDPAGSPCAPLPIRPRKHRPRGSCTPPGTEPRSRPRTSWRGCTSSPSRSPGRGSKWQLEI